MTSLCIGKMVNLSIEGLNHIGMSMTNKVWVVTIHSPQDESIHNEEFILSTERRAQTVSDAYNDNYSDVGSWTTISSREKTENDKPMTTEDYQTFVEEMTPEDILE